MLSELVKIKHMSEKIDMSRFCKQIYTVFLIYSRRHNLEVNTLSSNYIVII